MLNDAKGFKHIYICTGFTDLRAGIDRLASLAYSLTGKNPAEPGTIYLFCGRKNDRFKALLYEGDGWSCNRTKEGCITGKSGNILTPFYIVF